MKDKTHVATPMTNPNPAITVPIEKIREHIRQMGNHWSLPRGGELWGVLFAGKKYKAHSLDALVEKIVEDFR